MPGPVIGPLANASEAAVVAQWVWQEWARHEPGARRAQSDAAVRAALHGRPLPHVLVAREGTTLVGCAGLVAADLPTRPDLGPWLANVYVQPAWRGRGLGTALVEAVMARGAARYDVMYLYTFGDDRLYRKLGWRPYESTQYAGRPIVILRYLNAAQA